MSHGASPALELSDLIGARGLNGLRSAYLSATTSQVEDIALIADIEEITTVGPDTVILLSERAAAGGWMMSAALRYAWERRASALVVPVAAVTDTALALAARLDVALLSSERDATAVALEIAVRIGGARAGTLARMQSFVDRIASAANAASVVDSVSRELGGASVRLVAAHALIAEAGRSTDGDVRLRDVSVDVAVAQPRRGWGADSPYGVVVARVHEHEREYAERVLRMAGPAIYTLMLEAELGALHQSLPLISVAALTGVPRPTHLDPPSGEFAAQLPARALDGQYVVVCLLTEDRDRIGAAVHHVWLRSGADVPLTSIRDGWLAFVPAPGDPSEARIAFGVRDLRETARLLDLRVGISQLHTGRDAVVDGVRQAWLAARLVSDQGIVEFGSLSTSMLERVVPIDLAQQLAVQLMPGVLADPAAHEVITAVVAYLDHRGSVSRAAAALGVHRNTVQTRIRRAEALGVELADPRQVLSTHMLMSALMRHTA